MAFRKNSIGIAFPFKDSDNGDFFRLTRTPEEEIKSNLIHLLMTKKGSRFMLPSFGTNLYQYLFEPLDENTIAKIENEIHDAVEKFIPNLKINKIIIMKLGDENFDIGGDQAAHTIKINLDYSIQQRAFEFRDSVSIEL
jgi:phage baseplate assembly protein W